MCGNGAGNGTMKNTTQSVMAHKTLQGLLQGNIVCFAAVLGPTILTFAALLTASGTIRTIATTFSVSGWPEAIKLCLF